MDHVFIIFGFFHRLLFSDIHSCDLTPALGGAWPPIMTAHCIFQPSISHNCLSPYVVNRMPDVFLHLSRRAEYVLAIWPIARFLTLGGSSNSFVGLDECL